MKTIDIASIVGEFAEDKDLARDLRLQQIEPALRAGAEVGLDFSGVNLTTQSFIHALISGSIREHGPEILDCVIFKGCNDEVRSIVSTVVQYSQEGLGEEVAD